MEQVEEGRGNSGERKAKRTFNFAQSSCNSARASTTGHSDVELNVLEIRGWCCVGRHD
jgi:hypothetical protein